MSNESSSARELSKQLRELCNQYAQPKFGRALWQLLNTVPAFIALWGLMAYSILAGWNYGWTLLIGIPTAGLYVRMFIVQHDCGHGSFMRSERANNAIGGVLGLITLFPYSYWKKTHNIHHGSSGNLDRRGWGDIETMTVSEYRAASPMKRLGYRFYRNTLVLLLIGPVYQFLIKHRFPFDMPFSWKKEWASVWINNGLILMFGGLLAWWLGWQTVLMVHVPIVLIAGAAGVWLFYVQHTFEDAYWANKDNWDSTQAAIAGSSYFDLPQVMHWFTGNIGFHHIHHLASRIPNYRLREAFLSHPLLQNAPRLTLFTSFKCAGMKLWDEELRKMVGYPRKVAVAR